MRPGLPPIPPPRGRPGWVLPVVGLLVLALAGVGTALVLASSGSGSPDRTAQAPASASPAPAPTATATAPSPPPPTPEPTGGPVVFEGAVLTLPADWQLQDDGVGSACIGRTPQACELRLVLPDVVRDRGGELEDPRTDSAQGWYLGTDMPDCRSSRLRVRELAPIDDKRAEYREWELDCTGEPARLRLWWLPRTRFVAIDQSGDPALAPVVTEIVRTADLTDLRSG